MDTSETQATNNEEETTTNETASEAASEGASVIIYSTPVCHFCHAAKEFFQENNVSFTDYDVASNVEKRQEMIDLTGQMGVPVIKIGDDIIIGFDEPKIRELLAL